MHIQLWGLATYLNCSLEVVNGEQNKINLLIENKSELNVTLLQIGGSFHDAISDALIKNVSLFHVACHFLVSD